MTALAALLDDLAAEGDEVDGWIAGLDDPGWAIVTTPEGWTVAHQVGHLTWTDEAAILAVTDPPGFQAQLTEWAKRPADVVDAAAAERARQRPTELLDRWRHGRTRLHAALTAASPTERIAWFGPPMKPTSMATARIMETWAHGQDIADALDIDRRPTHRIRHVCHLAVRARDFAFRVRDRTPPDVDIRVDLLAPSGERWTWGSSEATDRVTGSALDFALLATRRRHRRDVDVEATGAHATAWLDVIQAFVGPPGNDPRPLSERSGS